MSGEQSGQVGFADPVDPRPHEIRAWAYNPAGVPPTALPSNWDLLCAGDALAPTLFELAMDRRCPARGFAMHCLYIYAADTLRPNAQAGWRRRRRLRAFLQRAEQSGDRTMTIWARNCRIIEEHPQVYSYSDWMEGGLVRSPAVLDPYRRRQ